MSESIAFSERINFKTHSLLIPAPFDLESALKVVLEGAFNCYVFLVLIISLA